MSNDNKEKNLPEDVCESVKQENERIELDSVNTPQSEPAEDPTDSQASDSSQNHPSRMTEEVKSGEPEGTEDTDEKSVQIKDNVNGSSVPVQSEEEPEMTLSQNFEEKNEIDEFTQKLLNRKTEMAIWPENEEKQEEKPEMSPEERKAAEATMSDALDQLRKQRGQVPIDQEEEDYAWDHIHFQDRFDGGDDFTTQSLFLHEKNEQPISENTGKYENSSKNRKEDYMEESEKRPVSKKNLLSDAASRLSAKESRVPEKKKRKKKRKLRKQAVVLICVIVVLILVLFAGYYYKTAVYDPANTVTEAQQAAYDKLLAYAEEYSMSSDAEKLELLQMENDYNSLSDKQKEELNKRFVANTGMIYNDLLADLKTKDGTVNTEDDPVYVELMDYINSYGSLDDDQKMLLAEYQSNYDSLSTALKAKADDAMRAQTGKSFNEALDDVLNGTVPQNSDQSADQTNDTASADQAQSSDSQQPASDQNAPVQDVQSSNAAQAAEYQQMIDQTVALRDDYLASLAEDGLSADGDEVVAEYDQQIAYWQGLLASVQ